MTSQNDAATEELISFFTASFDNRCIVVSVAAFVMYDWVVTLPREVQLFWTRKARPLSAALYFLNRYLNILTQIFIMVEDAPMSDTSCNRVEITSGVFLYLSLLPPAIFTALRSYALTQRWWLSAIVFVFSSIQFVTGMVALGFYKFAVDAPLSAGCIESVAISPSLAQIFVLIDRIPVILADTMLVVITWKLLPESSIVNHDTQGNTPKTKGLASILVQNGMMYFIVLSMLNVLHLLFTEISSVVSEGGLSYIAAFIPQLSSVLVSHFLLDLQEAYQKTVVGLATNNPLHTPQSLSMRYAHFAQALGSLSATVDPFNHILEEDDECPDTDGTLLSNEDQDLQIDELGGLGITEVMRGGGQVLTSSTVEV